ncbi:uncharacterized protein LOC9631388 [Selaginella moellendorffii]|nr:uncharacterized protein LOC9631388 [Selaginella moellendorffii]|eukprot:XP_002968213.2 uncharacterized protein LOC9631388 [Selaginella moellendorffii]
MRLASLLLVSALFVACSAISGDPPVQICINDVTVNISNYLRYTHSIDPRLDTYNYTEDYTAPMSDPPPAIVPASFAAAASKIHLLEGSSLHKVRIDADSLQGKGQQTNLEYLLMLDVDSLAYSFRNNSGLPTKGVPYGGWEAPDQELRGHFVGHYLSATAKMWASTHNEELKRRMDHLVDILDECQQKIGTGYLSAFPLNLFTRFETYRPVWAPYYTIHKIMAGLLDQYTEAGNMKALRMVIWMAQYFSKRVENYIEKYSIQAHFQALNEETGGMNDVLYDLYKITGDPQHLKLAHLFDKPCFLGPLALQQDTLSGFHANTHIPILIGAQKRYELTGDQVSKELVTFFMDAVNSSHRFVTGGTSDNEFWKDPNRMASSLGKDVEESCSSYNMLKIARNLFRWTKDASYMDYYERLILNGVLTIQRGEPGVMIYMLPMGPGMAKTSSTMGWGDPFDSFWCCYGTGIESFSKFGDSIYFEDYGVRDENPGAQRPIPALYVAQFVPSTLEWDSAGLILKQTVKPLTSFDPVMEVTIHLHENPKATIEETSPYHKLINTLYVRIPSWVASGYEAYFNDEPQDITPGSFLAIQREWKAGDKLTFKFPAEVRLEHIQDDREEHQSLNGIMFGPFVLAGLSHGEFDLGPVDTSSPSDWITPVNPSDNDLLYTFRMGDYQLGHKHRTVTLDSASTNGTDWDFEATFKVISSSSPSLAASKHSGLVGRVVSLELLDQPGRIIAHSGINKNLVVVDTSQFADSTNYLSQANLGFKVVPGLASDRLVSFESQDLPGCYIYVDDWRVPAQLKCRSKENDGFDAKASFKASQGLRSYHPLSFVATSQGLRNFLLFPQLAYRDEHYAIYFDMV